MSGCVECLVASAIGAGCTILCYGSVKAVKCCLNSGCCDQKPVQDQRDMRERTISLKPVGIPQAPVQVSMPEVEHREQPSEIDKRATEVAAKAAQMEVNLVTAGKGYQETDADDMFGSGEAVEVQQRSRKTDTLLSFTGTFTSRSMLLGDDE